MMEKNNLQELWASYDQKVTYNTQLNKAILKKILMSQYEKRTMKLKCVTIIELVGFVGLFVYISTQIVAFQSTLTFILGFTAYVVALAFAVIDNLRYTIRLLRINPENSLIEVRKKMVEKEQFKEKISRRGRMVALVLFISLWFVISPEYQDHLLELYRNSHFSVFVIPLLTGILTVVLVVYLKNRTTKKLKQELLELEELENN